MKSVDSIKKNMPLANLIHKVKSQQLFKNIYKRNFNVKCVHSATQLLKHHVQFSLTF